MCSIFFPAHFWYFEKYAEEFLSNITSFDTVNHLFSYSGKKKIKSKISIKFWWLVNGHLSQNYTFWKYPPRKNYNILLLRSTPILHLHFHTGKMRIQFYIANCLFCFKSFVMQLHLVGSKNLSHVEFVWVPIIINVA